MLPDLDDVIVAVSSAAGAGGRAIIRLSGAKAGSIANAIVRPSGSLLLEERRLFSTELCLDGINSPLPADIYVWSAPKTYTGQDMVEIHTFASSPLVELVVAACLNAGARAAQPGEFTMRAFLAGKMDLTRAEAVLGAIDAHNQGELRQALSQLAGGVSHPLGELRDDLLNLLADLEAGLDFADEDISFVNQEDMLHRVAKGLAMLTLVRKQLEQRSITDRPFRVVLVGKPNAGKSSLLNALARRAAAIVSHEAGTTRDYLVCRLQVESVTIELVDTAGLRADAEHAIENDAQRLGQEQADQADLLLVCVEGGSNGVHARFAALDERRLLIATKCDISEAPHGVLATSAVTGMGLDALRSVLAERARTASRPALAPSLSRCRHHVDACLEHLRRAHAGVLEEDPPEIIALEVRETLEQLGAMVGAVYTDDLLDRIFSRFCIGK